LQQVSLSDTSQLKKGGIFPLTLFAAVFLHITLFYTVDLRFDIPEELSGIPEAYSISIVRKEKSSKEAERMLTSDKATAETSAEEPILKPQPAKPLPLKEQVKNEALTAVRSVTEAVTQIVAKNEPEKILKQIKKSHSETAVEFENTPFIEIPKVKDVASLKLKYTNRIRQIIADHRIYPLKARRRGIQGDVSVAFSVDMKGVIHSSSVTASSGFSILDKAALEILVLSSPLPIPPQEMKLDLPISFVLN